MTGNAIVGRSSMLPLTGSEEDDHAKPSSGKGGSDVASASP